MRLLETVGWWSEREYYVLYICFNQNSAIKSKESYKK